EPLAPRGNAGGRGGAAPHPGHARALCRRQEEGGRHPEDQLEDALQPPERLQGVLTPAASAARRPPPRERRARGLYAPRGGSSPKAGGALLIRDCDPG